MAASKDGILLMNSFHRKFRLCVSRPLKQLIKVSGGVLNICSENFIQINIKASVPEFVFSIVPCIEHNDNNNDDDSNNNNNNNNIIIITIVVMFNIEAVSLQIASFSKKLIKLDEKETDVDYKIYPTPRKSLIKFGKGICYSTSYLIHA